MCVDPLTQPSHFQDSSPKDPLAKLGREHLSRHQKQPAKALAAPEKPYRPPVEGPAASRRSAQEQVVYTHMIIRLLPRRLWRLKATTHVSFKKKKPKNLASRSFFGGGALGGSLG